MLALTAVLATHCCAEVITGHDGVAVNMNGTAYDVLLDGKVLLKGGPHADPMLWGVPTVLSNQGHSTGEDEHLGEYTAVEATWRTAHNTTLTTRIKVFHARPALLFETVYHDTERAPGDFSQDDVVSSFPSFLVGGGAVPLGCIAWSGNQLAGSNVSMWTAFHGGSDAGVPLLLFDETLRSVMVGPYSNFMTSIHSGADNGQSFAAGVKASIREIPAGHAHQTLMYFGHGVNDTLLHWGGCLLARTGKTRTQSQDDFVLSHLGYWTDHGAVYYGTSPGYVSAEDALRAVQADALQRNIPLRYFQLDDWWYTQRFENTDTHGDFTGLIEWQPKQDVFPSGLSFLKTPLSLYIAMYSTVNVYMQDYAFYSDDTGFALPVDPRFYMDLFRNGTESGMLMFEQDFFSVMNSRTHVLSRDISVGDVWLAGMDAAAAAFNVTLQFCMMDPVHVLKTSEVRAATNGRASQDAIGDPERHLVLGVSAMLHYALGIWASADNVWTNSTQGGSTRADPQYETLLALLMGGPYGPGDSAGSMDRSLVMRTCTDDGVLLRADKPLTHMDSTFREVFTTNTAPNLWTTHSDIQGHRWTYLLGLNLATNYTVTVGDLGAASAYMVWEYWGGPEAVLLTEAQPFSFPRCPSPGKGLPTLGHAYYVATPVLPYGWVFYGETQKIVSASSTRIRSLATTEEMLSVVVAGAHNETYTFSFSTSHSTDVHSGACVIMPCATETCQRSFSCGLAGLCLCE